MTHTSSIPQSAGALWRASRRAAAIAAAGVAMVACSSSDLLEVQLDAITPVSAQSQAGALAQRAAAIRDFTIYFAYNVSAWSTSGLITDELINARGGFEQGALRNRAGAGRREQQPGDGDVRQPVDRPAGRRVEHQRPGRA